MIRMLRRQRDPSLNIGPADHGRVMSFEALERAKETDGYKYELIDGVLCVSPIPDPLHDFWTTRVRDALQAYCVRYPRRLNYIPTQCEVVIPDRLGDTRPIPDVAGYRAFPETLPLRWDAVCPLVVVEVISARRSHKDAIRNRHLYELAGGIREYWIIQPDLRQRSAELTALWRVSGRSKWRESKILFGDAYSTPNLPQFRLNLKELAGRK